MLESVSSWTSGSSASVNSGMGSGRSWVGRGEWSLPHPHYCSEVWVREIQSIRAIWQTTTSASSPLWRSGNGFGRINNVTLRRARLVLRWVTVFGRVYASVCDQPSGQLGVLPSVGREMSTSQSAATLYGWGVKAGWLISCVDKRVRLVKLCYPSLTRAIPERFRDEYRTHGKAPYKLLYYKHIGSASVSRATCGKTGVDMSLSPIDDIHG